MEALGLVFGLNWPTVLAVYGVWFAASFNLKSSPPDALPSWPLWVLFWPAWQLLMLIRVTQRTAFTEPLDPKRRYLICCSPHGAFAFSGITWVGPQIRLQLLPEYRDHLVYFGTASCLFYLPLVREALLLVGCREVTKSTAFKLLNGTKYSMAMIPGGIAEQIRTTHDCERHYVQNRLGFLRLALELGLDVVPMMGFGENQLFTSHHASGEVGRHLRAFLLKHLGIGLPIVTGRFGWTLLPHAREVVHVYGRPLKVGPPPPVGVAVSDAAVEELFTRYTAEVVRLFKDNAPRLLPPEVAAKGIKVVRLGVDKDDR